MTDLEIKAIKATALTVVKLTALAVAVPVAILILGLQGTATVVMIGMLAFAIKMIYDSTLDRLTREESEYKEY